jgi:hypothetical protein
MNKNINSLLDHFNFSEKTTTENVLSWLRNQNVFITALPYRNAEESKKLKFFYSIVDLKDFEHGDDIDFDEDSLGTSNEEFDTFEDAVEKAIEVYLTVRKKMGD